MKMRKQRLMGASLLAVSVLLLALIIGAGSAPEDRDATAVLLTAPLGVYLTVTPHYILLDSETAAEQQKKPERSLKLWQGNE